MPFTDFNFWANPNCKESNNGLGSKHFEVTREKFEMKKKGWS